MDVQCRIELLGWLHVQRKNRLITRFQTHKTGALLAYLAHYRHRSHTREELVELLWPEDELDSARHKLRMALSSLRRQLEPPGVPAGTIIAADRIAVQLNPAAVTTDVAEFEAGLDSAVQAASSLERAQQLTAAIELYRGELLPGYYEDWIVPERQRLAEAHIQALEQLAGHFEQTGDLSRAIDCARRVVAAEPLWEEAHYRLIRLLEAAAKPEAALRQYLELERLLSEEFDSKPSAEIQEFAQRLKRPGKGPKDPEASRSGEVRRDRPSPRTGRAGSSEVLGGAAVSVPASPDAVPLVLPASALSCLPTGTVTFLLAEWRIPRAVWEREETGCRAAVQEDQEFLRPLLRSHGGYELRATGDTLEVVFERASEALAAATAAQRALVSRRWGRDLGVEPVRMALHTGEMAPKEEVAQSAAFRHATRLLMAAHAGQILLSEQSAALLRGEHADGVQILNLGFYRLCDECLPEQLFQVHDAPSGGHRFPSPNALPGIVGHLPPRLTRFFGREEEILQLRELLLSPDVRLVTVTGVGGQGKTRLALEVGRRLAEPLRGAVWFVSLAELTNTQLILHAVRDTVDLAPSPGREPLEQLAEALAGQRALLILDNLEQLVPEVSSVVGRLLQRLETVTTLVTSRQRLGLEEEREFPLPPLRKPSRAEPPEELLRYESVQLFLDRAQAVRPDFQITPANAPAVAQLCERLDGLPLALELAAARIGELTPHQMVSRLAGDHPVGGRFDLLVSRKRDTVARHRTLRAAMEGSYQLLAPGIRRFFAQLSVFRGSWTLEAAEAVCEEPQALERLSQLRERSLLLSADSGHEMRFMLLETLREYAAERLSPTKGKSLAHRHAQYYLALAMKAELELQGPGQEEWLNRLDGEQPNVRAALDWFGESGPVESALQFGAALWQFWCVRGHWAEGRERLMAILAQAESVHTDARAKALHGAGVLAHYQGDYRAAQPLLESSLALWQELGLEHGAAEALTDLGFLACDQAEHGTARAHFAESLSISQRVGYHRGITLSLAGLGDLAVAADETETARSLYEESLKIRRRLGDHRLLAAGLNKLGDLLRLQGDWEAARVLFTESLVLKQEIGNKSGIATSLVGLANIALAQDDLETARSLFEDCLRTRITLGDRCGIAECLEGLAGVVGSQGQWTQAARLFGAAEALREELKAPGPPASRDGLEFPAAASSWDSGVEGFLTAWSEGRAMTLDQAIVDALGGKSAARSLRE